MGRLSFDEWRDQVNKLFLKHCVMTIEDAGVEDGELRKFYDQPWTPIQYVEWFAKKYDLDWHTPGEGWTCV